MSRPNHILDWLQERIDVQSAVAFLSENLRKPIPKHANFLYTFGSIALFIFALQAVTGILMLVYYKPTVKEAYDSVQYIHSTVPFGWLIRQIHVWGANLMVFIVFVHMVKTYFYGAYKKPRELTWIFGVVLFGIVLGFGFTGYLLPWDQLAFWATTVGTEAPGSMPVLGPALRELMRGQAEVGEATLGRFFVAHIILLPVLFAGAVGAHLFLIRYFGTSPLSGTDGPEPTKEEIGQSGGKPFWPNHVIKEGMACYIFLGIVLTLSVYVPLMPGPPADPFVTPDGIKPEWYFLPMFQLLKYLPEPIAVGLPGVAGLLIFLLPFLDRSPERHPSRRPVAVWLGIAFLVVTLGLGVLGALSETTRTILGTQYHFDAKGIPHEVADGTEETE
jgi:ubiquinol-cytochrome c reductase cytochrome b subunit